MICGSQVKNKYNLSIIWRISMIYAPLTFLYVKTFEDFLQFVFPSTQSTLPRNSDQNLTRVIYSISAVSSVFTRDQKLLIQLRLNVCGN